MPAVISFDTSIDITDEVVTRINADKPAVEAPAAE
jgi:hypothetical protein